MLFNLFIHCRTLPTMKFYHSNGSRVTIEYIPLICRKTIEDALFGQLRGSLYNAFDYYPDFSRRRPGVCKGSFSVPLGECRESTFHIGFSTPSRVEFQKEALCQSSVEEFRSTFIKLSIADLFQR